MLIDKETRYDRQLRLWATTGQSNLESSHICLINASSTGSEILKNLVLPGIGEFTIIDHRYVSSRDLSGNFFLKHRDLGKGLAEAISVNLNELNTDVKGHSINRNIRAILEEESPEFWDTYNVVIVSEYISGLDILKEILWKKRIPLLIVNTVGFYGSLNLIANEITVIETHDPSRLYDLRIDKPWPELQQFVDSIDLDALDDTDHAHIPYIVIYIKALDSWKQDHNNQAPQNYNEKKQFRKYIESLSRNINLEANFIEASNSIHRALQKTEIPNSIQKLFEKVNILDENLTSSTPIFWIYIKALKRFVELNNYQLPLPGKLPDMASDTTNYVKLQTLYREKAKRDQELFTAEVIRILNALGRSKDEISNESITSFCKNSQLLFVTQGSKKLYTSTLVQELLDNTNESNKENFNTLGIYFSILTFNLFTEKYRRAPSLKDLEFFKMLFIEEFMVSPPVPSAIEATFKETLSHNTRSYHNLSSLMGGVVSQEVLKLATAQYTPLDNLFVFDGVRSISEKWKI
ncbi:uncharacterized protein RJT20DRAFT_34593 [Scheffersomyces xylosifermentans]|uniref:uncharacterized protein n=1 Tax=Scheffersomyces xylosifermentans TaxID=1304137 RepID=UPI00315DA1BE